MGLFYDFNLCAVADACRICVVGINVHLKSEVLVYSDLNVKPSGASLAVYVYGNGIAILKTELCRIVKGHVDMSVCDNAAFLKHYYAARSYDGDGG